MSKRVYCQTCGRFMNSLGLASHRAAHARRGEKCVIDYGFGKRVTYQPKEQSND